MDNIAYIFPGQGAQYVGMGKAWVEQYPVARETFTAAERILDFDLQQFCFEGPEIELAKTKNAQPAILVTSIAILNVLITQFKNVFCLRAAAGLSLGEYSALIAAGSMDFSDAVKVTRKRGEFMEAAAQAVPGKMASIIGMDIETVEKICASTGTEVANLNCPGQIVISGTSEAIETAVKAAETEGARKVIVLNVSGPFHSRHMMPAALRLKEVLEKIEINVPQISFVCNVSANYLSSPQHIKDALIKQVRSRTRWADSINLIKTKGITTFLEIGPGRVLKGLLKRIDKELKVYSISEPEDLETIQKMAGTRS